jgi:hypothetical protein
VAQAVLESIGTQRPLSGEQASPPAQRPVEFAGPHALETVMGVQVPEMHTSFTGQRPVGQVEEQASGGTGPTQVPSEQVCQVPQVPVKLFGPHVPTKAWQAPPTHVVPTAQAPCGLLRLHATLPSSW